MIKDSLGDRMKNYYESASQIKLTRRTPVAIRLDGRAAHTFTRGFKKPFDMVFAFSMRDTMLYLCENIQGCKFGYTQSDEITLILTDYDTLETSAFFDYNVQKLTSVTASMAAFAFNKAFARHIQEYIKSRSETSLPSIEDVELIENYTKSLDRGLVFDARCFNIPKEEVGNLIYWRQLDAIRNSIQMVARCNFSDKELQGKSCEEMKEMLKSVSRPWDSYLLDLRRGAACYKVFDYSNMYRRSWKLDCNMPIIKDEWEYINKHLGAERNV